MGRQLCWSCCPQDLTADGLWELSCLFPLLAPSLQGGITDFELQEDTRMWFHFTLTGKCWKDPASHLASSSGCQHCVTEESSKSGNNPGSLLWKGRSYWPSISDFSFLWPQGYHKSLLRIKNQTIREITFVQRLKLLDFGKAWSRSERFILQVSVQHLCPSMRSPGVSISVRDVLITPS